MSENENKITVSVNASVVYDALRLSVLDLVKERAFTMMKEDGIIISDNVWERAVDSIIYDIKNKGTE